MSRAHRLAERARTGVVEISHGNHVAPATARGESPEALGAGEGERLGRGEGWREEKEHRPRKRQKPRSGLGYWDHVHREWAVA